MTDRPVFRQGDHDRERRCCRPIKLVGVEEAIGICGALVKPLFGRLCRLLDLLLSMRYDMKKFFRQSYFLVASIVMTGFAGGISQAATWCPANDFVNDLVCYGDGNCYVSTAGYGGPRWYLIPSNSLNKSQMVAIALTASVSGKVIAMDFVPDGLNCSDVPANTQIFGIRLSR